jgi:hypothetical protein
MAEMEETLHRWQLAAPDTPDVPSSNRVVFYLSLNDPSGAIHADAG